MFGDGVAPGQGKDNSFGTPDPTLTQPQEPLTLDTPTNSGEETMYSLGNPESGKAEEMQGDAVPNVESQELVQNSGVMLQAGHSVAIPSVDEND